MKIRVASIRGRYRDIVDLETNNSRSTVIATLVTRRQDVSASLLEGHLDKAIRGPLSLKPSASQVRRLLTPQKLQGCMLLSWIIYQTTECTAQVLLFSVCVRSFPLWASHY